MAAAVCALLAAAPLTSGAASVGDREWRVAADPRATVDEIIDAGHAADVATSKNHMVVTWEVQPEDDEGPYQGAWRLYDRQGRVADGTFGTVREASARINVVAFGDGFLLTDYRKRARYLLDADGKLTRARFEESKVGPSLADGVLVSDESADGAWNVLVPSKPRIVRLTDLPTPDVQGIELTSDGTVWVLLPWTDKGPAKVAHAKDGKPPWTTETIPLPPGSTYGAGISAQGRRLFVVASHEKGDVTPVDAVLVRRVGEKGWKAVDASGIADDLTVAPRIAALPRDRLVATTGGEGAWIQKADGSGFAVLHLPRTDKRAVPSVQKEGRWLWSGEDLFGNTLSYSSDYGRTWHEFVR